MAKKAPKNTPLSTDEIEHFKDLLLQKRREILGNVESMENETLRKENTDLSHMPMHLGDMGSDTFEMDNSLSLVDSERKIVKEIDQALERIENGNYGVCLGNGELIGRPRLEAIPWAKYSIEFANQLEKGLVEEPRDDIDLDETAA